MLKECSQKGDLLLSKLLIDGTVAEHILPSTLKILNNMLHTGILFISEDFKWTYNSFALNAHV
jgi:hypothetical protein